MPYQVKVFPFKDNEFSSIEEAMAFVEGYYQERNDIEGRRWISSHDGWEYPKPEANDTLTKNKPTELGIIRVRPTMNDSDYLSKKVSELKSKTSEIPIHNITFEVIPRYYALGYVSDEEVTKFDKEDLKRVLEKYHSKDDVIELLLRMLSNEGTVIKE